MDNIRKILLLQNLEDKFPPILILCSFFPLLLFSCSVIFNSLQPHGLQHIRFSCPSLSLGVCSNSFPLSKWCHPTMSSCHPLLLLPSIFLSFRVFSKESALCIRCPKYWSFSFGISPSKEYSGLISFRIDWFDLLSAQGTLESFFFFLVCACVCVCVCVCVCY